MRKREKILHTGESKKIQTLEEKKPIYIIKNSKFEKMYKRFSGWVKFREEEGRIFIQPVSESIFNMMKSSIGRNHFKKVTE